MGLVLLGKYIGEEELETGGELTTKRAGSRGVSTVQVSHLCLL